jgi:AmmeMemoRadiSam system protein B
MDVILSQKKRIRTPVGAGLFYPEEKKEILDYFNAFGIDADSFASAKAGNAVAIIAPHGAWNFSGELAARAFFAAMGRKKDIKRVVILGPIHDKREKGIFLSNSHSFFTPLGNIQVDQTVSEQLAFISKHIEINDIPHLGEHSIEILLPFVKYCFPRALIVPILMGGEPKAQYIHDLARALKTVISPLLSETLIVVSCNLSHDNDQEKARILAEKSLRLFSSKDVSALSSAILDGKLNSCGGALVLSLFESGLLDKTTTCVIPDDMVSAVSSENNTVFYSELSFAR